MFTCAPRNAVIRKYTNYFFILNFTVPTIQKPVVRKRNP